MIFNLKIDWHDTDDLTEDEQEHLRIEGIRRVLELSEEGVYREGELYHSINGVEYSGWWSWEKTA